MKKEYVFIPMEQVDTDPQERVILYGVYPKEQLEAQKKRVKAALRLRAQTPGLRTVTYHAPPPIGGVLLGEKALAHLAENLVEIDKEALMEAVENGEPYSVLLESPQLEYTTHVQEAGLIDPEATEIQEGGSRFVIDLREGTAALTTVATPNHGYHEYRYAFPVADPSRAYVGIPVYLGNGEADFLDYFIVVLSNEKLREALARTLTTMELVRVLTPDASIAIGVEPEAVVNPSEDPDILGFADRAKEEGFIHLDREQVEHFREYPELQPDYDQVLVYLAPDAPPRLVLKNGDVWNSGFILPEAIED